MNRTYDDCTRSLSSSPSMPSLSSSTSSSPVWIRFVVGFSQHTKRKLLFLLWKRVLLCVIHAYSRFAYVYTYFSSIYIKLAQTPNAISSTKCTRIVCVVKRIHEFRLCTSTWVAFIQTAPSFWYRQPRFSSAVPQPQQTALPICFGFEFGFGFAFSSACIFIRAFRAPSNHWMYGPMMWGLAQTMTYEIYVKICYAFQYETRCFICRYQQQQQQKHLNKPTEQPVCLCACVRVKAAQMFVEKVRVFCSLCTPIFGSCLYICVCMCLRYYCIFHSFVYTLFAMCAHVCVCGIEVSSLLVARKQLHGVDVDIKQGEIPLSSTVNAGDGDVVLVVITGYTATIQLNQQTNGLAEHNGILVGLSLCIDVWCYCCFPIAMLLLSLLLVWYLSREKCATSENFSLDSVCNF